jgi:M6 family metalloprotease-like protein
MRVARRLVKVVGGVLIVLAGALVAGSALAAPLRNVPQTLRQPDGTVVHLFVTGDEYYNRLHDANGFTVVRDPDNGYLVYAMKIDGRLQPTGFVVGKDDPAAAGLAPDLMPDPRTLPSADELYPMARHHAQVRTMSLGNAPAFSAINNLVVFVSFADETTPAFWPADTYQAWFNSGPSSMEKYFLETSYDQLTVSSTFYPAPTGTTVVSFRDAHNRSYYRPYNATTNADGYQDSERNGREWALLQAAVDSIASQVPTSLDLDTNRDGYIDSVVFVVSGSAGSGDWSNLLWPHRWAIDDAHYPARVNGKLLGDYNLQLNGNVEVGVLCHEMTHTLGAPDLYHYSSCPEPNTLVPVGRWDLMAEDRDPPQHTTAYLKWRYLGFIGTIPAITQSGDYTLNPLTSATDNCYRIASPNSTSEYFVVEYRKPKVFDTTVPGSGLLVYRIDTAADGQGDRCGPPDEVYVYRPGGTLTDDGNINHANFSGNPTINRTMIDDSTDPAPFLTSGLPGGLSISNVGQAGDTISFHVAIQQGCVPAAFSLAAPANGANLAPTATATLSWTPAAGATSYDVYFGTDPGNPALLANQTAASVQVAVAANASYFWRVAARNACGQVLAPESGTWAFCVGTSNDGITIFSDDLEGDFPGKWKVSGVQGHAATAMWGKESCNTRTGSGSVWCAAGGTAQPACSEYVRDHGTFLIYGPMDLSDAAEATLDFDAMYDINDGGNPAGATDWFEWLFSVDGKSFGAGDGVTGTSNGWTHVKAPLSQLKFEDGTSPVGKAKVWVGFVFVSSPTTTPKGGAYIDNVVIKKIITQPGSATHRLRRHLPRQ